MAIGVPRHHAVSEAERSLAQPDGSGRNQNGTRIDERRGRAGDVAYDQTRLPVDVVVRALVVRHRPSPTWSLILEQLDTWPLARPKSRDPQPRAEYAVQTFLLDAVVQALPGDAEAQDVAIEPEAGRRLSHHDGRVVDPSKQASLGPLPSRIAFPFGEFEDLQGVTVRILDERTGVFRSLGHAPNIL